MGQIPPATTTPVAWTTIKWSIIPIQVTCERLWPGNKFSQCINCDIDHDDIWVKVMTHPWVLDNVWNTIQIQHGSEELWPVHRFWVCVHCDLYLGDMTLGQGHDTPLGHGQQLCEIISRSVKGLRSYGPDMLWTERQKDRQTDGQTDRHGDSYIPPPQTLFARGIITLFCNGL